MKKAIHIASVALALACSTSALADEDLADDHAPIGVMADHVHKKGELMFSLRVMHMEMRGNQIGTDNIDPQTIVTTVPNRFFGMPMQPATLRIVPIEMQTDMYMIGAMYAPSDAVTLMVMGNYLEKEMTHITFQGGMGTSELGEFTTNPKSLGDTKLSALFPLLGTPQQRGDIREDLTLKAGISLPTGSIRKTDDILTPMGGTPRVRLPYMMQIGTGTWDLEPALTYKRRKGRLGLGVQVNALIKLGTNDAGYSFGDQYEASAWTSYRLRKWMSLSARVRGRTTGRVKGIDPSIMGPVQTANPDFQGGESIDLLTGVNLVASHGALAGHRLGIEVGVPVYQNLNGPQMAGKWSAMIGWQKAF